MGYANGRVPATVLITVAPNTRLLTSVGHAYLNMQKVYHLDNNMELGPAGPYGAGYRDFAMQSVFYNAAHGNRHDALIAHLDPNSRINIAAPGYSSHGWGDRIDILFNGHSPDTYDLDLANRYGFTREFGASDENHFKHDGRTAISGVLDADKVRLVGRFLNTKHLGKTTQAEHTSKRDPELIWMVQHYGHMMKWYPASCVEDGITGHYTEICMTTICNHL